MSLPQVRTFFALHVGDALDFFLADQLVGIEMVEEQSFHAVALGFLVVFRNFLQQAFHQRRRLGRLGHGHGDRIWRRVKWQLGREIARRHGGEIDGTLLDQAQVFFRFP